MTSHSTSFNDGSLKARPSLFPALLAGLALVVMGCNAEPAIVLTQQTLTVGCGRCIFEMEGVEGCPWAAEIDGQHYLIRGALPDHESHEADGICNMTRQAVVDGEIRGDELVVSSMVLVDADSIPETPRFAPEDQH